MFLLEAIDHFQQPFTLIVPKEWFICASCAQFKESPSLFFPRVFLHFCAINRDDKLHKSGSWKSIEELQCAHTDDKLHNNYCSSNCCHILFTHSLSLSQVHALVVLDTSLPKQQDGGKWEVWCVTKLARIRSVSSNNTVTLCTELQRLKQRQISIRFESALALVYK